MVLLTLLLIATPVDAAAASDGAARRLTDALAACRALRGDAERLACYDRTAAALTEAVAARQVSVVDRDEVRRTRRELFGFPLPRVSLFGGGDADGAKQEEVREVDGVVASAAQHGDGLWSVKLEDGSSWRFNDPVFLPPKHGDRLRIKRGALGSYMGSIQGRIGVRIHREG